MKRVTFEEDEEENVPLGNIMARLKRPKKFGHNSPFPAKVSSVQAQVTTIPTQDYSTQQQAYVVDSEVKGARRRKTIAVKLRVKTPSCNSVKTRLTPDGRLFVI